MFYVRKLNKNLVVVDDNNCIVYTIPKFIRVNSRSELQLLVNAFNERNDRSIQAIVEWESIHRMRM